MKVAGSLGDDYAAVALVRGHALFDDFKGAVGGAIVGKDVLQFALVVLRKSAFDSRADVLLAVVGEQYIGKLGQGGGHIMKKSRSGVGGAAPCKAV